MGMPYLAGSKAEGLVVDPWLDSTVRESERFTFRAVVYAGWSRDRRKQKGSGTLILASRPLHWHVLRHVVEMPELSFEKARIDAERFERDFDGSINTAKAEVYFEETEHTIRDSLFCWLQKEKVPDAEWANIVDLALFEGRRRRLGTLLATKALSVSDSKNAPQYWGVPDTRSPSCRYYGPARNVVDRCLKKEGVSSKEEKKEIFDRVMSHIKGSNRVSPTNNTRKDSLTYQVVGYAAGLMALEADIKGVMSVPPNIKKSVHIEKLK